MRLVFSALCALLVVSSTSAESYRLNSPVKPKSYVLTLTPDIEASTFTGHASILVSTAQDDVTQIKLHSDTLEWTAADVSVTESSSGTTLQLDPTTPLSFNETLNFAYINLSQKLQKNVDYTVAISYSGTLRDDYYGFFKGSYVENGIRKYYVGTQLAEISARTMFPCFDEQSYKATFTLIIDRPPTHSLTLANTAVKKTETLSNGYTRETFYPTPVMSTYLVAFSITNYKLAAHNKHFGIYTKDTVTQDADFAMSIINNVVEPMSKYFGINYYDLYDYQKILEYRNFDMSGMENLGHITFTESKLVFDESTSHPSYKLSVAQTISEELVNGWFGNLVPTHWFSDYWLTESFSSYFGCYFIDKLYPDWNAAAECLVDTLGAMTQDEGGLLPMSVPSVETPYDILDMTGANSYLKGGAIVGMMHHLLGDSTFQAGIRKYLNENRNGIAYPSTFYSAMESAAAASGAMEPYGDIDFTSVMGYWVEHAGVPLVTVKVHDGKLTLTQEPLYYDDSNSDQIYPIPITYTTESLLDFTNTKPAFIFNNKSLTIDISDQLQDGQWIMLNIQSTGYYRVMYEESMWRLIAKALRSEQHSQIHALNRQKIMNDAFRFYLKGLLSFDVMRDLYESLKLEIESPVWLQTRTDLYNFRQIFNGDDFIKNMDEYTIGLVEPGIQKLGYFERKHDTYSDIRARYNLLYHACRCGHKGCIESAKVSLAKLRDGIYVPASDRRIAYTYGIKYGTEDDFEFLYEKLFETRVVSELEDIIFGLSATRYEEKLAKFIDLTVAKDNPVMTYNFNIETIWVNMLLTNADKLDFALKTYEAKLTALEEIDQADIVWQILVNAGTTLELADKIASWAENCSTCSSEFKSDARIQLEDLRISIENSKTLKDEIKAVLTRTTL